MASLAEDLTLLTAHVGKLTWGSPPETALAGAEVADLALRERVDVRGGRIAVTSATPTGDEQLDGLLAELSERGKPRKLTSVVRSSRRRGRTYRQRLVTVGGLRREERALLPDRFTVSDEGRAMEIRARVEQAVADPTRAPVEDTTLAALAQAASLARALLPGREGAAGRRTLKDLAREVPAADAAQKAAAAAASAAVAAAGSAAALGGDGGGHHGG